MSISDYPAKLTNGSYRVRTDWEDVDSQVGAYRILKNAIARCDANPGTYVFDDDGNAIYPEEETGEEEQESIDAAVTEDSEGSSKMESAEAAVKEESDAEEFPEAEKPIAYAKLKTRMNIRMCPSLESNVVTTCSKGTIVHVLEILSTGWLRIVCEEAEDGVAYVSNAEGEYAYIGASIYTVVSGDTLWKIAEEKLGNGTLYKEIRSLNGLTSNVIKVGTQLILP